MNEHEKPDQPVDATAAAEALRSIDTTRGEVMKRVGSPPGYYFQLGVAMALITASQPFGTAVKVPAVIIAVGLMAWAIRSYSTHTGSLTMATLREPGAWMAWLMMLVIIGGVAAALLTEDVIVSVVAAAIILAVVPTVGPRWDAAWVRSLEDKA